MHRGDDRRIRYAVVGLGAVTEATVLPAFEHASQNSELAAILSNNRDELQAIGGKYHVATGSCDRLSNVLRENDIEAAYVTVPNALHRAVTEELVRAGVHVLCEKPMATTTRDCQAMMQAARDHHVKLMVAYRAHFERANLDAIELILGGKIGEPRFFSSVFSHQVRPGNVRMRREIGHSSLFDMGVYCINAARYFFQAEPQEVMAMHFTGTDERAIDAEEMTSALLRFPDHRAAQFIASEGAANVSEYRVVGTLGDVRLDPAYDYSRDIASFVTIDEETRRRTYAQGDQFAPLLQYFSQCILDDVTPDPTGDEGLADVRVMEALVQSARTRAAVKLSPPGSRICCRSTPSGDR